jgi:hypothetical protein
VVLDRVVQHAGLQGLDVADTADARHQIHDVDRVIDVGRALGVLALLAAVLVRGEQRRLHECGDRERDIGVSVSHGVASCAHTGVRVSFPAHGK